MTNRKRLYLIKKVKQRNFKMRMLSANLIWQWLFLRLRVRRKRLMIFNKISKKLKKLMLNLEKDLKAIRNP